MFLWRVAFGLWITMVPCLIHGKSVKDLTYADDINLQHEELDNFIKQYNEMDSKVSQAKADGESNYDKVNQSQNAIGNSQDGGATVLKSKGQKFTKNDVTFSLFLRDQDVKAFTLSTARNIASSVYRPERITRFVIHGYTSRGDEPFMLNMKDALLKQDDVNVFLVDWERGGSGEYQVSAAYTDIVGAAIAEFIHILENETVTSRVRMHLIGFSLSGHVSAAAGKRLQNPKLARISGLDVPDYGFNGAIADNMLDQTDAEFVDEMHTSVSVSLKGHADFFVNGGLSQPACPQGFMGKITGTAYKYLKGDQKAAEELFFCDHNIAPNYYIESINANTTDCYFLAKACRDYRYFRRNECEEDEFNFMGFHAMKPYLGRKKYYLETRNEKPYCLE